MCERECVCMCVGGLWVRGSVCVRERVRERVGGSVCVKEGEGKGMPLILCANITLAP